MKVLHVIPSLARSEGGPPEALKMLIGALTSMGVRTRVISSRKAITADDEIDLAGIDVQWGSRPVLARWTLDPKLIRPIAAGVRWADVVHVHSLFTFPSSVAMWMCVLFRTPFVVEPHGVLTDYQRSQRTALKRVYRTILDSIPLRYCSRIIVSSTLEKVETARDLPRPQANLIALGVDDSLLSLRRMQHSADHVPRVLFLGRVTAKKRVDLLIDALGLMKDMSFEAHIAGPIEPIDRDRFMVDLRALKLADRVKILGPVDRSARKELLSACDIFVLPSDDESFGVAVAEAMAAGCACVVSDRVGVGLDAASSHAVVVTDRTPTAVAANLSALVADSARVEQLGLVARAYARTHFSWARVSESVLSVYRAVESR